MPGVFVKCRFCDAAILLNTLIWRSSQSLGQPTFQFIMLTGAQRSSEAEEPQPLVNWGPLSCRFSERQNLAVVR
jgi:hypothetical protein